MKIFNPQQLASLLYEAPDRTKQTIKTIAKRMGGIDAKYLSRQLNPDDPGAKLGVEDFIYFSAVTDLAPLDYIEEVFDRTAFVIPMLNPDQPAPIMKLIAKVSKEYSESINQLAKSLEDGVLEKDEIKQCLKENMDLIKACLKKKAYLKQFV